MIFIIVILVTLGIFVGSLDMVRAVFRRAQINAEKDRAAVEFALANFDLLKDQRLDLITMESLFAAKFRISQADRHHLERLSDKLLSNFGHAIKGRPGSLERDVFALSRRDLERSLHNIG